MALPATGRHPDPAGRIHALLGVDATIQRGCRLKPVIALHGHGTWGGAAIVRTPDDPLGAALNQELNYEYAGQLARQGYMVFVPELRGFGNRLEDPEYREGEAQWVSSCYAVGVNALLLGKTFWGCGFMMSCG